MGILDGGIQSLFGAAFGSFYLNGTLVQVENIYDDQGGTTEQTKVQSCKYQEDQVSETDRASGGFSQKEKRFIILQYGITGILDGDAVLTTSDGDHYALRTPEQDPAKSYWLARGTPRDMPVMP